MGETQLPKREPANLIDNKVWELECFMDTLFAAELRCIGRGFPRCPETPFTEKGGPIRTKIELHAESHAQIQSWRAGLYAQKWTWATKYARLIIHRQPLRS